MRIKLATAVLIVPLVTIVTVSVLTDRLHATAAMRGLPARRSIA